MNATFLEQHESFCKGLGLDDKETCLVGDIVDEAERFPDPARLDYDLIKTRVVEKGGREPVAIAAYSLVKAQHGERLMYLLIGSVLPSIKTVK